jgi:hypothetical protein
VTQADSIAESNFAHRTVAEDLLAEPVVAKGSPSPKQLL